MKFIAAGGRDYRLSKDDYDFLYLLDEKYHFTEVATGRCRGADSDVEEWCRDNLIRVNEDFSVPPWVWSYLGKKSGPVRNTFLSLYAKENGAICVLFPGGKGTSNMFMEASHKNLEILLAPSWGGRRP